MSFKLYGLYISTELCQILVLRRFPLHFQPALTTLSADAEDV